MKVPKPVERLPAPPIDLLLCSSGARWNAAVRTALTQACNQRPQMVFRLYEAEDLRQLEQMLHDTACALVGLEVGEENLRVSVDWLTALRRPAVPVVGLLATPPLPADVDSLEYQCQRLETLATLVREAGAVWTLASPLEARDLLHIAARHVLTSAKTPPTAHQLSRVLWRSLPWQSTRRPLRLTVD